MYGLCPLHPSSVIARSSLSGFGRAAVEVVLKLPNESFQKARNRAMIVEESGKPGPRKHHQ